MCVCVAVDIFMYMCVRMFLSSSFAQNIFGILFALFDALFVYFVDLQLQLLPLHHHRRLRLLTTLRTNNSALIYANLLAWLLVCWKTKAKANFSAEEFAKWFVPDNNKFLSNDSSIDCSLSLSPSSSISLLIFRNSFVAHFWGNLKRSLQTNCAVSHVLFAELH